MHKQSDRIKQCFPDVLSISVPQARPAELALNPAAILTATARLCVNGLLTALMTRRPLKHVHHKDVSTFSKSITFKCIFDETAKLHVEVDLLSDQGLYNEQSSAQPGSLYFGCAKHVKKGS